MKHPIPETARQVNIICIHFIWHLYSQSSVVTNSLTLIFMYNYVRISV